MNKNENGEVAIKYYITIPQHLVINGNEYMFMVRANICMAWVKSEDVGIVLSKIKTCCGGQTRRNIFRYASEDEIRRWENGGGR